MGWRERRGGLRPALKDSVHSFQLRKEEGLCSLVACCPVLSLKVRGTGSELLALGGGPHGRRGARRGKRGLAAASLYTGGDENSMLMLVALKTVSRFHTCHISKEVLMESISFMIAFSVVHSLA